MSRLIQIQLVLGALLTLLGGGLRPSYAASGTPPTFVLGRGTPVNIEQANKILRARTPTHPKASFIPPSAPTPSLAAATGCATGPSPAIEITQLASSLKCDIDLIFEYVYNNIEYEPLYGSNKGPLGTLLDQRGNDIDQAELFVALLTAAGFQAPQIDYMYGNIRLSGTQASSWLGVKNDGHAIFYLLQNGGIPLGIPNINTDGTLNYLDIAHVWVQVTLNGTNYVFDPSFKQHVVLAGINNLGTVLGYTRSQFLADAGGTIDNVSIGAIDRSASRNDLVSYANSLISYIKAQNPAWTISDIIGGKSIEYLTGSPIRQTVLPYLSPSQPSGGVANWGAAVPNKYRTCFTISMPGVTPTNCSAPSSQTIQLYADQTYGYRITIFSTGSACAPPSGNCTPTLLIDGEPPPNGQSTGTALPYGQPWSVNVSITHPYTGSLAQGANQSDNLTIAAGGSYLVSAGWGQVGRGMIEKHRQLLAQALAAGDAPNSEAVLGESLAVISYSWLAELAATQRVADGIGQVTTQYHHGVGITAQAEIQGQAGVEGPYVDLPMNFVTIQPQTNYTGSGVAPNLIAAFFADSGVSSSLESAVLEQTQALVPGMQAASTVRLVDMNLATGAKTYFADGTSTSGLQAYFNDIRPNLSGYSSSDLSNIDNVVSTNGTITGSPTGQQVLMPANGSIKVGLWTGAGYTISQQTSTTLNITQKISGGLSGGYSGSDVPPTAVAASTPAQTQPPSADPSIAAGIFANVSSPMDPLSPEPVDAVTGAYVYQHSDLTTGGGVFPYALSFARTYSSALNTNDIGMGYGWAHSYDISATRISDPYVGLGTAAPSGTPAAQAASSDAGENSGINAAAAIAAMYVAQDLLNGSNTKNAQYLTLGWLVSRWFTDQLTNNAVLVSWPGSNEEFAMLPHVDGAPSGSYNAPLGVSVQFTGSDPDQYGNFSVFKYVSKHQAQILFNPVNTSNIGSIASWTFPFGVSVNFDYNYSYGGNTYLTNVVSGTVSNFVREAVPIIRRRTARRR